ncbi:MAG: hypothetical protein IPI87_05940 [Betaproteobacteria bacterium]|nr:hypothetical protein [Betaproteobacteria bacterium]
MSDARLVVKGDLARFPFADPKQGTFTLTGRAQGATLDYAAGWPAVSDIDGEVRFDGAKVAFDMSKGRVYGAQIGRTKIAIDDLLADVTRIKVDGEATGPTAEFLHFIETSPVGGWIGGALAGAQATGNGALKMRFELPLGLRRLDRRGRVRVRVEPVARSRGAGALAGGRSHGVQREQRHRARPVGRGLRRTGDVLDVHRGRWLPGDRPGHRQPARAAQRPARCVLRPRVGHDRLVARARIARFRHAMDGGVEPRRGATIDLPAPAGKVAADSVPLRLERKPDARGATDAITIDAARVGRVLVQRQLAGATPVVDRVLVLVGRAAAQPADNDRGGVWIRGDVAALDVDAWLAVKAKAQARSVSAAPSTGLSIRGVDLDAAVLEVFGRKLNDVKVSALDGRRLAAAVCGARSGGHGRLACRDAGDAD